LIISLSLALASITGGVSLPAPLCNEMPPVISTAPAMTRTDSTLLALFDSGLPYSQFLANAQQRREGWLKNTEIAHVDATLVLRARAVGGNWKLLVVAIDSCGDSMNSVPFISRLVDSLPGFEMRIVPPDKGRAVQEAHRTLDGRAATPTFVLIDASGNEAGCIVELPHELRHWAHALRTAGTTDSLYPGKTAFYERDKGKGITTELVELLEAAKAGKPICDRGKSPG
jgi:hypothetical protein